jgi:hypothetical protein
MNKLAGGINVEHSKDYVVNSKIIEELVETRKKEISMNKNFENDMTRVKEQLESAGMLEEHKSLAKGSVAELKRWSIKNFKNILEIADNGARRVWKKENHYDDPGNPFVAKKLIYQDGHKLEVADDDRVMGIPYAQAMAGDRVYIINGKVFTGWSLYFSLSSIKSPEDYARNVDLVYNVPYLYASLLLKAQLGLGTGFDVNYGSEDNEVAEEKLCRKFLFEDLKINTPKLVKTGFHLFEYGNAYWALRRNPKTRLPNKITILQPERLKIFLDPMTTRILFYIYLPPIIGGTTIASYPSDGRYNPNILTGVTLSYPTPIVMHPEDVMHFKINDFTEYPFGFSDVKTCLDPATARLDANILAPIIFKKYAKPMIHWKLKADGLGPKQVQDKINSHVDMLENMEPGSDPVTTDLWDAVTLVANQGKNEIFNLTADMDTQIFAATGAPETYFKPKGSTDRMISEQDKTFISRLKIPQSIVSEEVEEKLIRPRIDYEHQIKAEVLKIMGTEDKIEEFLRTHDSYLADAPKYPKVVWNETFKQDETQAIANAIALTNAGIIDRGRAAVRIGEIPRAQTNMEENVKIGIDDSIIENSDPNEIYKSIDRRPPMVKALDAFKDPSAAGMSNPITALQAYQAGSQNPIRPNIDKREVKNTPQNFNEQENMETLRGGLNMGSRKDDSNRNIAAVKDPSQLGGSRYKQHQLKGGGITPNTK